MSIRDHLRRAGIVTVVVAASMGVAATPGLAGGDTVRYPSAACPDTGSKGLQACVDARPSGSTIVLVDEIIDEAVVIDRSLTLRGESRRFRPRLSEVILLEGTESRVRIVIQDLRVERTIRTAGFETGSDHRIVILRVEVGRDAQRPQGIQILARVPVTAIVEDSWIRAAANQYSSLMFYVDRSGGPSGLRAVGNRISQAGYDNGGSGIDVTLYGSGTTDIAIHSNSVFHVAGSRAGGSSGILVHTNGSARADVHVTGNTVARSEGPAFTLWNSVGPDGHVTLGLFDNSLSHSRQGVVITDRTAGTSTIRSGSNNVYRNSQSYYEGRGRGPGDLARDPRFVDLAGGDLRLRAGSPLIDRGVTCQPGGLANRDAAGRNRVAGKAIDIGAYERGAGAASGKVVMGTSGRDVLRGSKGADILCGLGGDDRLCARDGRGHDFVDGGSGRDRARTDAGDRRRSIEATGGC